MNHTWKSFFAVFCKLYFSDITVQRSPLLMINKQSRAPTQCGTDAGLFLDQVLLIFNNYFINWKSESYWEITFQCRWSVSQLRQFRWIKKLNNDDVRTMYRSFQNLNFRIRQISRLRITKIILLKVKFIATIKFHNRYDHVNKAT